MPEHIHVSTVFAPWKLLIVDDDPDVHQATRMALRGVTFRGRTLEFIDAYSGTQALECLQKNPDTAVVFLDVVMETDDAGLRAALHIRERGFTLVRLIVRTGFPGRAPERQVIVDYDIHDYQDKTGLSVQKLFTSVISALRAYDDLLALEDHRRGLMGVLEASSSFDFNAVQRYVSRMLAEFTDLARLGSDNLVAVSRPSANALAVPAVLTCFGRWDDVDAPGSLQELSAEVSSLIVQSLDTRRALSRACGRTLFANNRGVDLVVFAAGEDAFVQSDAVLLEMFLMNVCQAISNHMSFSEMAGDRDAVLRDLALHGERWDANATLELDRLAALATAMATRLQTTLTYGNAIDARFICGIGIASQLHNLGNDAVLIHVLSQQAVAGLGETGALGLARAILAGQYAHFDGSGDPGGLAGDAIALAARLVAVADAYVVMTSARPHRLALDAVSAQALMQKGAGTQFDPRMVEALLDVLAHGIGT